jgi:uncharacterized protein (DUF1697 family)
VPRQIVLLRGINLGARNRVSMPELRAALEAAGYSEPRTLLQSGNVVMGGPKAAPAKLERLLRDEFGLDIAVVVRTRDELAAVSDNDPFAGVADDPKRYQVSFLSKKPSAAMTDALERAEIAPERVAVRGREIYAWHANGIQRSPLARLLSDDRLGVTATARNWNTVTKLLALADAD